MTPPSSLRLLLLGALALSAAAVAQPKPLPEPRVAHGVAAVECSLTEPQALRSHAAIVAAGIDRPAQDLLLTVAHGLPPTLEDTRRDCVVIGEHGERHAIAHAWLGGDDRAGDWALLLTERALRGGVTRLPIVEPATTDALAALTAARASVQIRHGAADVECELRTTRWLTRAELNAAVYAHSCESWPGLSGAPMVFAGDGPATLIGIHIGQLVLPPSEEPSTTPEPPASTRSLGRGIDAALAAALTAAKARIAAAR